LIVVSLVSGVTEKNLATDAADYLYKYDNDYPIHNVSKYIPT
jgi:hypothetical protein